MRHRRHGFSSCIRKIPWRRAQQPTAVFLPGESHGQRSLVGYSPWGHKESGMTELTEHAHTQSDSVLFVRSFLTLSLGGLSPESGHFWLPHSPGCRWSGRTLAGPYANSLCKPRKVLTLGGCSPVLRFMVGKQDTNWNSVSICLLAPTLAQGPACVPPCGGPEDGLGLLEVHPEKLRRWIEERMLSGSLVSGVFGDRREAWAYFFKLEVFKMGPLDS